MIDSALSIKNASGKTFSLLNDNVVNNAPFKVNKLTASLTTPIPPKRKYHCNELGCNKSFTTSGHLARHHRIHTGEKNFQCLHPGCPSRFSRQDNMMQHYRTHLSQKARRQQGRNNQKRMIKEESQLPQLYRHTYHGPEDRLSYQPLVNRPRRSVTMPSMPYPNVMIEPKIINRPRRALSTSSSCSDSSMSSFTYSPPTHFYEQPQKQVHILPPPFIRPAKQQQQQQGQHDWNNEKSFSNLLHLANIVSTFG